MADFVRYYVGDVVQMKKAHPCGCNEWEVLRIGVCKETIKMRW